MAKHGTALATAVGLLTTAAAQTATVPAVNEAPDCRSVVIIKCEKSEPSAAERARREAIKRGETRRTQRGIVELDRVIIEGDAERPDSPEAVISRALSRPLVRQGENSFAIGESAQCTCMNICPPPPFPCCQCTDRVGSRQSSSPGWAPTR